MIFSLPCQHGLYLFYSWMPMEKPACVTTLLQTVMNTLKMVSLVVVMLPLNLTMVVCSIYVYWTTICLLSIFFMKRNPCNMDGPKKVFLPALIIFAFHAPCVVVLSPVTFCNRLVMCCKIWHALVDVITDPCKLFLTINCVLTQCHALAGVVKHLLQVCTVGLGGKCLHKLLKPVAQTHNINGTPKPCIQTNFGHNCNKLCTMLPRPILQLSLDIMTCTLPRTLLRHCKKDKMTTSNLFKCIVIVFFLLGLVVVGRVACKACLSFFMHGDFAPSTFNLTNMLGTCSKGIDEDGLPLELMSSSNHDTKGNFTRYGNLVGFLVVIKLAPRSDAMTFPPSVYPLLRNGLITLLGQVLKEVVLVHRLCGKHIWSLVIASLPPYWTFIWLNMTHKLWKDTYAQLPCENLFHGGAVLMRCGACFSRLS